VTGQSQGAISLKRRHAATGKPRGGLRSRVNVLRHGLRSKAFTARRKAVAGLASAMRKLLKEIGA
jgi:hypothetical protein